MIILIFIDFDGNYWTLKNPPQTIIDKVEFWNPNSIMKVYDFDTCEILTFVNYESFKWSLIRSDFNDLLNGFTNSFDKPSSIPCLNLV